MTADLDDRRLDGDFDTGDTTVDHDLDAAEAVSCTFTNTQRGSLTIIKDTVPNRRARLRLHDDRHRAQQLPLDDDADGTLAEHEDLQRTSPTASPGRSPRHRGGYSLSDIVCTGATDSTVVIGASGASTR